MRAGIALGSNLGDRLSNLKQARDRASQLHSGGTAIRQSPVYETTPLDCEPGAHNFFNAVIDIEFEGSPEALLHELHQIEQALGRPRDHARNVSRTIDLDLLYLGDEQRSTGELQLPHPRMKEREFVLRPLARIAPELRLPGETATIRELLAQLLPGETIRCVTATW